MPIIYSFQSQFTSLGACALASSFRCTLLHIGNEKEIEGVFKKLDKDGDGQVTFEEFDDADSDK